MQQAVLYRRERQFVVVGVIGDCLRKSARDIGVSFVRIDRVLLCDYFPADYADHAEEYSKLYYFAEKDRLEFVLFWGLGFVCDYLRDLRETLGFLLSALT